MKNYSRYILTAIMILAALSGARAAAPANDNFAGAQTLNGSTTGVVNGDNTDATQEADEPNHYTTNPNKQSVWYKWTAPATRSMAFEIREENFASAIAIYTSTAASPTFAQLTKVQSNADILGYQYKGSRINFWAQSGKTYYIAVDFANAGGPGNPTGAFELKYFPNSLAYSSRFDTRDHRTSVTIYRPSESKWFMIWSFGSIAYETLFGSPGDTPMLADYDGDGRTDFAVVRNENGAKVWYVSFISQTIWGLPGDKALVGDFDDDGRADPTAVRSNGQNLIWYIRRSTDAKMMALTWGIPTDKPVIGDFDGDRITDITITRSTPNGLVWYILRSNGGAFDQYTALQFGLGGDETAAEDFDGDGKTDIAVFRPSNGVWYIVRSSTNEVQIAQFGLNGDKPQPGDYDGDGKADLGLFRPSTGSWHVQQSGNGVVKSRQWGIETDIPLSSVNSLSQN